MSPQQPTEQQTLSSGNVEQGGLEDNHFPAPIRTHQMLPFVGENKEQNAVERVSLPRPDFLLDIIEFHEKFGINYEGKPRVLPYDLADFRSRFNLEELTEWRQHAGAALIDLTDSQSMIPYRLEEMLDAHVDQFYVLLGTVYLQGLLPVFEEAWRRVHAANMAKVRAQPDGSDSKRGSAYDVVKPEGWVAPDHSDLVQDHAHR